MRLRQEKGQDDSRCLEEPEAGPQGMGLEEPYREAVPEKEDHHRKKTMGPLAVN